LPDNFVPRPTAFEAIKGKLLGVEDRTLVVSAIAGLGGIGKSVLATAVVLDEEVRQWFDDGILWVTLGQNPDLLSLLGDWIRELDKSREAFSANTLEAAKQYLGTLLVERQMLLVVDDVWNAAHAEWFRVGGVGCRVLVTTREARLEGAEYHDLDLMSEAEAIELIRQKLGAKWQPEQEAKVRAFANLLGRLPLALDLAANQVRDGLSWAELRSEFEAERQAIYRGTGRKSSALKLLDSSEAWELLPEQGQRKYSLQACFNLSLKRLKREQFDRFAWLGVLPEDVNLSGQVAAVLWDVSPVQAKKALIDLRNRSFLTGGVDTVEGEPSYQVHDLMHDMARDLISSPTSQDANQLGGLGLTLTAAHRQFLERYRAKTPDRRWDKLPSDGYIHRHLTWHMVQADWQDEIHALMAMSDERGNNAWFEACDRIGKPAIFVEDVGRAWELAEQMYESEPMRSIVLQCRYALIMATLNSLVANLPIGMMAEFVKKGFWSVEKAWAYVEQLQNEYDLEKAIGILKPYLTKPLFSIAVEKARSIRDNYHRFWTFLYLADEINDIYFSEAVAAARLVEDDSSRASALIYLAEIDRSYLPEAVSIIRSIKDESNRVSALGILATIDRIYLSEAIAAARSIQDELSRSSNIIYIAKIDPRYLSEAITAARSIEDVHNRARALGSLAQIDSAYLSEAVTAAKSIPYYSDPQSLVLRDLAGIDGADFHELLEFARTIEEESNRSGVLSSLVQIKGADLAELLAETRSIDNDSSRAHLMTDLAEVDRAYFGEALATVRSIDNDSSRAILLSRLAKIDNAYFSEAIAAARSVIDEMYRERVLISLVEIEDNNYSELLALSRSIHDDSNLAYALIDLAKIDRAYFPDALSAARSVQKDSSRAYALIDLAKIDRAYLSEAVTVVRSVLDELERVKLLIRLAEIDRYYFSEALISALSIKYDSWRSSFLVNLAKIDGADLPALLAAARSLQYPLSQANVLISLAEIDRVYLPQAADVAHSIEHNFSRAITLINLVKIDKTYFSEALDTIRLIEDESNLAKALSSLAEVDGANFAELFLVACSIEGESSRAHVLSSLAKIDGADVSKLLEAINSMDVESNRAKVLSSLSKVDSTNLLELLNLARSTKNESNRSDILIRLAEIDSTYFAEALDTSCLLRHEFSQAMRFGHLAEIAPQDFLIPLWQAIEQIADKPTRAISVSSYITRLPLHQLPHPNWCKYLHILASRRRSELMEDLAKLYPAILYLGGETAMRGVVDVMDEVCGQWK
jgi:hypothetical protein